MKITGEQLFFLIEVLKDSLKIQLGYDWNFTHRQKERKVFYKDFMHTLISQQDVDIAEVDLSEIKKLK